ncbi:response regulator [Nitratidesulfovibrio liaohensis]|uniref:Response regulator n=1 Tax=Nitratidesulfovibrio liaohensis TaxID=2604158 RepID=A0ABY9R6F6_9BACT|nr:response regulator [Nitratidesulfovibrio liaohensis]WMW66871.1 response regulator [Nitratidesulfovibrio liaohensis]
MRILVIDDEVPTLKMFGLLLEALGHEPLAAESGEEGLIRFDRERPDVVLTDIKMPGIDGMDVLRALKEADPRSEVIVITGHGDTELAIEALHLDATDFINKPVRREALEHALARAEERIRLKRAKEEEIRLVAGPGGADTDAAHDGAAVVRIRGTVNSPAEPVLRHVFEEALLTGAPTVVLDFEPSVSVNGAGIAVLAELVRHARGLGRAVRVTGVSPNLSTVFDVVGIAHNATVEVASMTE